MADIFISYAKEDRLRVEPLARALEAKSWSVWWDQNIPPGRSFSQVIEEALNAAKCIIVIWSNKSIDSDWVHNEAAEGARRKILVPVVIEKVQIPFEFRRIQAANLIDWNAESTHTGFNILIDAIAQLVEPQTKKEINKQIVEISDSNTEQLLNHQPGETESVKLKVPLIVYTIIAIAVITAVIWLGLSFVENRFAINKQTDVEPEIARKEQDQSKSMEPRHVPAIVEDKPKTPSLHLIVVAINHYRDKALRLKYAVSDAKAIADTFRQTCSSLYNEVRVTMLLDDEVTIKGFDKVFRQAGEAIDPQDVFMIYLTGHGVTFEGQYYFLPQDFRYTSDQAVRQKAINQDHLKNWLSRIPAYKSIVLIDTCDSGAFSQSMWATREIAKKASINLLAQAIGHATIFVGTDEQPAAEGYQGHGVFTYALLQGLRYADSKNGNRDGYTSLSELVDYLNEKVPSITMGAFNFKQIPLVHLVGEDFPICVAKDPNS
jgi:hypothetical protein